MVSVVWRENEARDSKSKKEDHEGTGYAGERWGCGIYSDVTDIADYAGQARNRKHAVKDGAEGMGAEGEGEVAMNESGKAGGEAAAGTRSSEQDDTKTRGQPELGMGAMPASLGMEIDSTGSHPEPENEPRKLPAQQLARLIGNKADHSNPS